jgi:hypothetical protein
MPTTRTAALRAPRDARPDAPHLTLVRAEPSAPRDAVPDPMHAAASPDLLARTVDAYGWAL